MNRQLHVGVAFMIAAFLVALLPLFKRTSAPPPSAQPAPIVRTLPSRLQAPDLHAKPTLVATASEPGRKQPVVAKPGKQAKIKPAGAAAPARRRR